MTEHDDLIRRGAEIRKLFARRMADMTPQERDRLMQTHLAQVRGPVGNARALRIMTSAMLRWRRGLESGEPDAGAGDCAP